MKDLEKILGIIKRTGEKYIFSDEEDNFFIISAAEEYEKSIDNKKIKKMSEEELLNKINNDIALWQASQDHGTLPDTWDELKEKIEESEEDQYYFEPFNDE